MRLTIALLATLLTFILCLLIIQFRARQHKQFVNRMEYFSGANVALRQQELRGQKAAAVKGKFRAFVRRIALRLQNVQRNNRLDFKMQQADWPLLGSEFEVMLAIFGALCATVVLAATLKPLWAISSFFLGIIAGVIFLDIYIKRRQKLFTNQLADMLTMVANALRAGFSFMQAFELIAREMDAPIGREVQKVVNEVNVGGTFEAALENMQRRVASSDFELVVTAVLIQRQVGGNLAQILDTISATIGDRIKMRRDIMALTAQGRLSGMVLAALPIVLGFVLYNINPSRIMILFEDPTGQFFAVAAVILEIIGYIVIQKIVDIKM